MKDPWADRSKVSGCRKNPNRPVDGVGVTRRPVGAILCAAASCRRLKGANAMPPLDRVYDYSQYGGLMVQKQDKVMTITLNAPEAMNAFSAEMHYSMSRIWEDVQD